MPRKPGQDLTQGPVARSLFRLTAPMMLAVSSSVVVQMIEIGFIGQLGTAQIAAVTFTFPITMMLTSVAMGISIGTSSVIARRVGGGDWDHVRRLATHSLLLVGSLLSLLALVLMASIRPTFAALGANGEVLDYIHDYLLVYYPGTVLFTVTMVAGSTMRATGDARSPGLLMTGGAALNLALDPILIFGLLGAPRLGLTGAALAMVLSRLAMTGLLLYFAAYRDRLFLPVRLWRKRIFASWREVSVIGIPAMATQMIGPISGAIVTRLLAAHGHDVVAGFGVAGRI
ncbi:MAG TPA: MATE family efflux transporter, partial [Pseudomonadales bacterium]|nr:MATE family efflux transporter [Pseudomonadales bacterium]